MVALCEAANLAIVAASDAHDCAAGTRAEVTTHPLANWSLPTVLDGVRAISVSAHALGWLERAAGPRGAHGAELVESLMWAGAREPRQTDDLLAWWLSLGLVAPGRTARPTASQRFLGSGGVLRPGPALVPPSWYRWTRVGPIWLRGS